MPLPLPSPIVVAIRVRPFTRAEIERNEDINAWDIDTRTNTIQQVKTNQKHKQQRIPLQQQQQQQLQQQTDAVDSNTPLPSFSVNQLFSPSHSTEDVYERVVRDIVSGSLCGMNGTVFAYGQTASGKTYTMNGLISLSLNQVFSSISQRLNEVWLVRLSYMEIYQEKIRDLLCAENGDLKIHQSRLRGVYVEPKEEIVQNVEQVMLLIEKGEQHRHYGRTMMNDFSSRSHTIFRLIIENKAQHAEATQTVVRVSVLNFVDLAGSERAQTTAQMQDRFKEGMFINKSLLQLGLVISKLSEKQHTHSSNNPSASNSNNAVIPFRGSKLTHILSSSLGGNSRTAIICHISASIVHSEHSLNTLRFGSRAIKVKNHVTINEVCGDAAQINKFEGKIRQLQNRLSVLPIHSNGHSSSSSMNGDNTGVQHAVQSQKEMMILEDAEAAAAHAEARRLLEADRQQIQEERLALQQQIASFKAMVITATSSGWTQALGSTMSTPSPTSSASSHPHHQTQTEKQPVSPSLSPRSQRRRRATFGGDARLISLTPASKPSTTTTMTAEDEAFFRSEQQQRKIESLEEKILCFEQLCAELTAENTHLMQLNTDIHQDQQGLTVRLSELTQQVSQLQTQLSITQQTLQQWSEANALETLSDVELQQMYTALQQVTVPKLHKQMLWREFCIATGLSLDVAQHGHIQVNLIETQHKTTIELNELQKKYMKEQEMKQQMKEEMEREMEQLVEEKKGIEEEKNKAIEEAATVRHEIASLKEKLEQQEQSSSSLVERYAGLSSSYRALVAENTDYSHKLLAAMRQPQPQTQTYLHTATETEEPEYHKQQHIAIPSTPLQSYAFNTGTHMEQNSSTSEAVYGGQESEMVPLMPLRTPTPAPAATAQPVVQSQTTLELLLQHSSHSQNQFHTPSHSLSHYGYINSNNTQETPLREITAQRANMYSHESGLFTEKVADRQQTTPATKHNSKPMQMQTQMQTPKTAGSANKTKQRAINNNKR